MVINYYYYYYYYHHHRRRHNRNNLILPTRRLRYKPVPISRNLKLGFPSISGSPYISLSFGIIQVSYFLVDYHVSHMHVL
jgi:hypothetical protein